MNFQTLAVITNDEIAPGFHTMTLSFNDALTQIMPGQFMNIYLVGEKHLLPRPFSVFDATSETVSLFYKVCGKGTSKMSQFHTGQKIRVLLPLGNHFPLFDGNPVVLLAGGIGIAPMVYYLTKTRMHSPELVSNVHLYYGASSHEELFFIQRLKETGCRLSLSTDDGSAGQKGTCVDAYQKDCPSISPGMILACGPKKMLEQISRIANRQSIPAYLSLEEIMGCGFGACMGCAVKTQSPEKKMPYQLVCKDGPVFKSEELLWE